MGAEVIIGNKVTLDETSDDAPALAVHNGRLWLAWIGVNNHQLNVVGVTTRPDGSLGIDPALKQIMGDSSDRQPALASFNSRLWIAWIGRGNDQLNVMGSFNGNDFDVTTKQTMGDSSSHAAALAPFNGRLWIAWTGQGNAQLNVMGSVSGNDFDAGTKQTMGDASGQPIALVEHEGRLWIIWAGGDNLQVNVMASVHGNDFDSTTRLTFAETIANVGGVAAASGFQALWVSGGSQGWRLYKVDVDFNVLRPGLVVFDSFFGRPALALFDNDIIVAWTGLDDDHHLNLGRLGLF